MSGPLAGLKIIEMLGLGPAPLAGQLMADLGAEVTIVDRKFEGVDYTDIHRRNKKSVALNLKTSLGHAAAKKLINTADIFEDEYIQPVDGFDLNNKSILYKVFLKSKQPGLFLEALTKVQSNYQNINSFDVNWKNWINDNLLIYVDQKNKYNNLLCTSLVKLIENTSSTDITVTDMTMFAHIVDCCESLHLPIYKLYV